MGEYLEIVVDRPGMSALNIRTAEAPSWSTVAIGGFGEFRCDLSGDWRGRIPYLSQLTVRYGGELVWTGQVEDNDVGYGGVVTSKLRAFGLKRVLEETTVQRVWSKRDLDWNAIQIARGTDGTNTLAKRGDLYQPAFGSFDSSDQSLVGVEIRGAQNAGTAAAGDCHQAEYVAPSGLTLTRVLLDYDVVGSNHAVCIHDSVDGVTWNRLAGPSTGTGSVTVACTAGATMIRLTLSATGAQAITTTIRGRFTNIRLLGTSLTEDAAGGFYGGTILRDIVALTPNLEVGVIETGDDFTIQVIERVQRDTLLSVVDEVSGYYTHEWAVWESTRPGVGRFDWRARNLDQADWTIRVADCRSVQLDASIDGIARTVYLIYADAASGLNAEATATSTAQRNPYVRQARAKDVIVNVGFPMTAVTAGQLAQQLADDLGQWVPVNGTLVLSAPLLVRGATGPAKPALCIRAGENIQIPDLPRQDLFSRGRDGETLFHIVTTNVDYEQGVITLELEGHARRADVQLARLAATR